MDSRRDDEDIFHDHQHQDDQANLDPIADHRKIQYVEWEHANSNYAPLSRRKLSLESTSQNVRSNSEQTLEDAEPQLKYLPELTKGTKIPKLSLSITPSLVDLITKLVNGGDHHPPNIPEKLNSSHPTALEKFKAVNFPAEFLKIGAFEKCARHDADLVAKIYYAKRKIVWEILDDKLKKKLEMQWSDILSLRATIVENRQGILEIELNQPPAFFRELYPIPGKHTNWKASSDFTGGEASSYRRHCVVCRPGIIDKHYEKLLRYDERLLQLSKRYPFLDNPYFDIPASNFDGMNGGGSIMNPNLQQQILGQPMLPSQQNQYANTTSTSFGFNDLTLSTSGHIQDHNLVSPAVEGMAMQRPAGHGYVEKTWNDSVYIDRTLHYNSSYVAQFPAGGAENHLPFDGSYIENTNGLQMITHADSSGLLLSTTQKYSTSSTVVNDVMPCAPPSYWPSSFQVFDEGEMVTNAVDNGIHSKAFNDQYGMPCALPSCWPPPSQVSEGEMVTNAVDKSSLHPYPISGDPISTVNTNASSNGFNH